MRQENGWDADLSVRAGLQFDGVLLSRNMQLLLEYFHGHSPNGQFYKQRIESKLRRKERPWFVLVDAGAYPALEPEGGAAPAVEPIEVAVPEVRTTVT